MLYFFILTLYIKMIQHIYYWFPNTCYNSLWTLRRCRKKRWQGKPIGVETETKTGLWKHALQVVEIIVYQDKIKTVRKTAIDYFVGLGGKKRWQGWPNWGGVQDENRTLETCTTSCRNHRAPGQNKNSKKNANWLLCRAKWKYELWKE